MMWRRMFIFYCVLFINFILAEDVGDSCIPNNELAEGECKLIMDCEPAVRAIRKRNYHQFQRCGFYGDEEIVCCPSEKVEKGRKADRECKKIVTSSIPPLGQYIIGGEISALGEFPHMVAVGFDRGNGLEFDCGGSLVSKTYVLTAAHCIDTLDRIEPSVVRAGVVEIGTSDPNPETDVRIAQIKTYPMYTRREKYHDLALLRLEKPLKFTSTLNAACLFTSSQDPTIPLTVTGWGQTSVADEHRSPILLKANVTAVARDICNQSYNNYRKLPRSVTNEQLCAGDPDGLHDTCQGDSGGPLQAITEKDGQYRLVGITSFGRGCGTPIPGIYTRIYNYLDWIESVVWPN